MGFLGNPVHRVEDERLLLGRHHYVEDLHPGEPHVAVFVRSTEAHGRIQAVTCKRARSAPGVVWAGNADDLTAVVGSLPHVPGGAGYLPTNGLDQPVLATDRVRYVGEPLAVVVALSREAAVDAAELVEVDLEPLPAVVDVFDAQAPNAPLLWEHLDSNVMDDFSPPITDDFFATADIIVSHEQHCTRVAPASLEPRASLAGTHPDTGELTLWTSTQQPHRIREQIAEVLQLEPDGLRVIAPDVGGGFGAKAVLYPEDLVLVALAQSFGFSIRWAETRRENLVATCHGRSQRQQIRLGAKNDGTLVALAVDLTTDCGAYPNMAPLLVVATTWMAQGCYRIPKVATAARAVMTNTTPVSAYRGAGRPEATYLIERAVDLLALRLGMDTVELRRRNFVAPDEFPFETGTGQIYDTGDYAKALDTAVSLVGYDDIRAEQRRSLPGRGGLLGVGFASYVEITGGLGEGEMADVSVDTAGNVTVVTGTSPHGQGHETTWAQITADVLGVSMEDIEVVHGDTGKVASGGGTVGSRSAQFGGAAVQIAAEAVATELLDNAAELLEAAMEDVELVDGGAQVRGTPSSRISLGQVVQGPAMSEERVVRHTSFFEQTGFTFPSGAHAAVVRVDPETGAVDLLRFVAVDDCGRILNPMIVEGQVHGGVMQGIAQALFEEVTYDPDGQPQTTTFADYLVPSACEVPSFTTQSVETPTPLNPLGAKGIGESGTIGSLPAIVNAVADALRPLGIHHIDPPLSPERVWRAIVAAGLA